MCIIFNKLLQISINLDESTAMNQKGKTAHS